MNIATISLLLLLASTANVAQSGVFDLQKYGAKPGRDITQALTKAWKEACAAGGTSKIVISKTTYNLGSSTSLQGPCKGPMQIQLDGIVKAPANPHQLKTDGWLVIGRVDSFTLSGTGTLDGQGATSWKQNDCGKNTNCKLLATTLRLDFITNGVIQGITFKDPKSFHINVLGCNKLKIQHITITAPTTSLNTDGIHIGRSNDITISDTTIGTGDDCISLGDGSKNVTIQRVKCGPGHGISIGSLGRYFNEQPVARIKVQDCTFTNTMNGVRIKTWPASPSAGIADGITFKGITMNNVSNPVNIDQGYCPYSQCTLQIPSRIKISNLNIEDIKGTSATLEALKIICSKGVPCQNVKVSNIDLSYHGAEGKATTVCENVKPTVSGTQNPPICPRH